MKRPDANPSSGSQRIRALTREMYYDSFQDVKTLHPLSLTMSKAAEEGVK